MLSETTRPARQLAHAVHGSACRGQSRALRPSEPRSAYSPTRSDRDVRFPCASTAPGAAAAAASATSSSAQSPRARSRIITSSATSCRCRRRRRPPCPLRVTGVDEIGEEAEALEFGAKLKRNKGGGGAEAELQGATTRDREASLGLGVSHHPTINAQSYTPPTGSQLLLLHFSLLRFEPSTSCTQIPHLSSSPVATAAPAIESRASSRRASGCGGGGGRSWGRER